MDQMRQNRIMNIVTLELSHQEAPLLPPGMKLEANQTDPATKLLESFNSWLSDRNYTLQDMSNAEIYRRLHKLGGVNHNSLYCELAYQKTLIKRDLHQNVISEPLLPPGI